MFWYLELLEQVKQFYRGFHANTCDAVAGKSKLAIQLALKFNGEVVSADAMQIYQGLDIATNKVTQEEMQRVPHHLMSFLDPLTLGYSVKNFRDKAVRLLDEIWSRNCLPVIVGGTNYYIESLVWQMLIDDKKASEDDEENDTDLMSFQVAMFLLFFIAKVKSICFPYRLDYHQIY